LDPSGTTSFTYKQLGQVLTKTQMTGMVTLPVTYTYDTFGRLSSLKYPSTRTITYSYDTSGRISVLSTGGPSRTDPPPWRDARQRHRLFPLRPSQGLDGAERVDLRQNLR